MNMMRRGAGGARPAPVDVDGQGHRPRSVMLGGGVEGRRFALAGRPLRVGSADGNDLLIHDDRVSPEHCVLETLDGYWHVRDLGSTNGTWVGGVRVLCARVEVGTVIRVGRSDIRVLGSELETLAGGALVACSEAMRRVVEEAAVMARLPWPVLIEGDTGAGKEGVARLLHAHSRRPRGPLVAVNAGALPRELAESELFGHERGAFTGAHATHRGVFEQAAGGTLFLDEIGDLPPGLQARLLRVLEEWAVRRVGGEASIPIDVRLVCATHRDLRRLVADGQFRSDLFYRLARLTLRVPALSERPDDILALAEHFLADMGSELGPRRLSRQAAARLLTHPWPGNARELRNVLCAAAATSPSAILEAEDVERALGRVTQPCAEAPAEGLREVVERYRGNVSAAARALGMPRSTLRDRLKGPVRTQGEGTVPARGVPRVAREETIRGCG